MKEFNKTKNLEVKKLGSGKSNFQKKKEAIVPVEKKKDKSVFCETKPKLREKVKNLIVSKLLKKSIKE